VQHLLHPQQRLLLACILRLQRLLRLRLLLLVVVLLQNCQRHLSLGLGHRCLLLLLLLLLCVQLLLLGTLPRGVLLLLLLSRVPRCPLLLRSVTGVLLHLVLPLHLVHSLGRQAGTAAAAAGCGRTDSRRGQVVARQCPEAGRLDR
jgi:hypothetical protein